MEKNYSISSSSLRNFVQILYLWVVVHFASDLKTSNFATVKWASPYANIWFVWQSHILATSLFVFISFWWNNCSANFLLPKRSWLALLVYVSSRLHLCVSHTATLLKSFIWIIFLLIATSFSFSFLSFFFLQLVLWFHEHYLIFQFEIAHQ